MNKTTKKIIGVLVAPIFIAIYFYDRFICLFIPIVNSFDVRIWFNDEEEIRNSLIRTLVVSFFIGLTLAVRYLIINF
jgi:hypothetical protein